MKKGFFVLIIHHTKVFVTLSHIKAQFLLFFIDMAKKMVYYIRKYKRFRLYYLFKRSLNHEETF